MIRILQENDRDKILEYVSCEPEMNLFLIGDLENFGVCSEQVNFYVYEEKKRWDFLVLRYRRFFIIYSRYEDYNKQAAIEFLKEQDTECISGKVSLLWRLAPAYPELSVTETYMSRLNKIQTSYDRPKELETRLLTGEDIPEAIALLYRIKEFEQTYQAGEESIHIKEMQEEMEQGAKYMMGGYADGRLVSIAATSAENSESAMIVGVASLPEYRNKGYASYVVTELCGNCFARGKKYICLFYDNPTAGRIYNRIGFAELGKYGMMR